jgi:hypothetical protein
MTRRNAKTLQAMCDRWNAAHPVGTLVEYAEVKGLTPPTRHATQTPAQVLSGHTPVVWLEGKRGCVCLDHCRPARSGEPSR